MSTVGSQHIPPEDVESPVYSRHARQRTAQRNINAKALEYILRYGHLMYRTGIRFYVLSERDIPRPDRRTSWISQLIGAAILLSRDNTVITVYRNHRSLRRIRHKARWQRV